MYGFASFLGIPCFRFTEELFATLIAFIFIFNAFKKLMAIRATSIVLDALNCESCNCTTKNLTQITLENITKTYCEENSGTWVSVILNGGSFTVPERLFAMVKAVAGKCQLQPAT